MNLFCLLSPLTIFLIAFQTGHVVCPDPESTFFAGSVATSSNEVASSASASPASDPSQPSNDDQNARSEATPNVGEETKKKCAAALKELGKAWDKALEAARKKDGENCEGELKNVGNARRKLEQELKKAEKAERTTREDDAAKRLQEAEEAKKTEKKAGEDEVVTHTAVADERVTEESTGTKGAGAETEAEESTTAAASTEAATEKEEEEEQEVGYEKDSKVKDGTVEQDGGGIKEGADDDGGDDTAAKASEGSETAGGTTETTEKEIVDVTPGAGGSGGAQATTGGGDADAVTADTAAKEDSDAAPVLVELNLMKVETTDEYEYSYNKSSKEHTFTAKGTRKFSKVVKGTKDVKTFDTGKEPNKIEVTFADANIVLTWYVKTDASTISIIDPERSVRPDETACEAASVKTHSWTIPDTVKNSKGLKFWSVDGDNALYELILYESTGDTAKDAAAALTTADAGATSATGSDDTVTTEDDGAKEEEEETTGGSVAQQAKSQTGTASSSDQCKGQYTVKKEHDGTIKYDFEIGVKCVLITKGGKILWVQNPDTPNRFPANAYTKGNTFKILVDRTLLEINMSNQKDYINYEWYALGGAAKLKVSTICSIEINLKFTEHDRYEYEKEGDVETYTAKDGFVIRAFNDDKKEIWKSDRSKYAKSVIKTEISANNFKYEISVYRPKEEEGQILDAPLTTQDLLNDQAGLKAAEDSATIIKGGWKGHDEAKVQKAEQKVEEAKQNLENAKNDQEKKQAQNQLNAAEEQLKKAKDELAEKKGSG